MIVILGYLATFLFIHGMAAEAVKSYRDGYSNVSKWFVWSLVAGYACMITYTVQHLNSDPVHMMSYITQFACLSVIGYFRFFPRSIPSASLTEEEERLFEEMIAEEESMEDY